MDGALEEVNVHAAHKHRSLEPVNVADRAIRAVDTNAVVVDISEWLTHKQEHVALSDCCDVKGGG